MKKKTIFLLFFALPIVLSSYAQTEVNKDFIASTPLEKAVKNFAVYVTGKYINDTYIKKISLEHQTWPTYNLKIEIDYLKESEHFYLEGADGVMIYRTEKTGYSKVQLFGKSKTTDYWGNYTKKFYSWSAISNIYADTCFILIGNIVEAYKEQTIKGYKTTLNYQQRLELIKKTDHLIIEKKSVVKLISAGKEEKYYKSLKKRQGESFEVWDDLYLNPDLRTYNGELYDRNGLGRLMNVEVEFISPPPGITEAEIKKQQQQRKNDSLFAIVSKEQFELITSISKSTINSQMELFAKNGYSFVDESKIMAYTEISKGKAYGQTYKLEPNTTYVFNVTGVHLNKVEVLYGSESLILDTKDNTPYFANISKPLVTNEKGLSQYMLTITTTSDFSKNLLIEVYGEEFIYAFVRRFKKKK